MKGFLNFLSERAILTVIIIVIYYLLVVLLHQEVSDIIINLVKGVPRNVYQGIILGIGLIFLFLYIFLIVRNILIREWNRPIIFYFLVTILLVVLSFEIIIIHNIEIIHFAQYAGLSIFIFPLTRRFWDTIVWATILGFIDEAYQYLVLKPDGTDYFDFNDVILNIIGAGLGLVLIFSNGFEVYRAEIRKWYRSGTNIALMAFVIVIGLLFITSVIQIYQSEDTTNGYFVLVKVKETGFWKFVNSSIGRFHVVRPLEGTIIIILLMLFYSTMDRITRSILAKSFTQSPQGNQKTTK